MNSKYHMDWRFIDYWIPPHPLEDDNEEQGSGGGGEWGLGGGGVEWQKILFVMMVMIVTVVIVIVVIVTVMVVMVSVCSSSNSDSIDNCGSKGSHSTDTAIYAWAMHPGHSSEYVPPPPPPNQMYFNRSKRTYGLNKVYLHSWKYGQTKSLYEH